MAMLLKIVQTLLIKHGNIANKHIIMNNNDKQSLAGQIKKEYGSEL